MSELAQLVNALRRPRLLLRAVRHGLTDYNRDAVLKRVLGTSVIPGSRKAVAALISSEEVLEASRRAGDAAYSVARHVEVLVALVAEARTLSSEAARAERDTQQTTPIARAAAG